MGSWTGLFLSSRCRGSRNRSLERGPLTASPIPFEAGAFTAPVVDYEPPPLGVAELNVAGRAAPDRCRRPTSCTGHLRHLRGAARPPSSAALHGSPRRVLRPVDRVVAEPPPPRAAATFADAALRRVLEVIDRRRPIAQLRPMLTPPLLDMVFALTRTAGPDKAAVLRRVRLRTAAVDDQRTPRTTGRRGVRDVYPW